MVASGAPRSSSERLRARAVLAGGAVVHGGEQRFARWRTAVVDRRHGQPGEGDAIRAFGSARTAASTRSRAPRCRATALSRTADRWLGFVSRVVATHEVEDQRGVAGAAGGEEIGDGGERKRRRWTQGNRIGSPRACRSRARGRCRRAIWSPRPSRGRRGGSCRSPRWRSGSPCAQAGCEATRAPRDEQARCSRGGPKALRGWRNARHARANVPPPEARHRIRWGAHGQPPVAEAGAVGGVRNDGPQLKSKRSRRASLFASRAVTVDFRSFPSSCLPVISLSVEPVLIDIRARPYSQAR